MVVLVYYYYYSSSLRETKGFFNFEFQGETESQMYLIQNNQIEPIF